jgi:hypothetical protein
MYRQQDAPPAVARPSKVFDYPDAPRSPSDVALPIPSAFMGFAAFLLITIALIGPSRAALIGGTAIPIWWAARRVAHRLPVFPFSGGVWALVAALAVGETAVLYVALIVAKGGAPSQEFGIAMIVMVLVIVALTLAVAALQPQLHGRTTMLAVCTLVLLMTGFLAIYSFGVPLLLAGAFTSAALATAIEASLTDT